MSDIDKVVVESDAERKRREKRTPKAILKRLCITIPIIFILFGLVGRIFQDDLMFHPETEIVQTPADAWLQYEDVTLNMGDGTKIKAWYIPVPDFFEKASGKTILFFQGNGGNMSMMVGRLATFYYSGYSVVVIDYPGYGESEGKPSEDGVYESAELAWKWLVNEKKTKAEDIVVYGFSMGGAAASWMAEKHPDCAALVLDASFTKAADVLNEYSPVMTPISFIALGDSYDTSDRLSRLNVPLVVMHSPDDEIIPYVLGRKNYDSYAGPKRFVELSGKHMDFDINMTVIQQSMIFVGRDLKDNTFKSDQDKPLPID